MAASTLRIVAGQYRRTPIPVPDVPGLRPTPDRVRETLFNWLAHLWDNEFADKRVLDLFAGSGALGFEALSRGAAGVVMLERQRPQFLALQQAAGELGADAATLLQGDALLLLAQPAAWQPAAGFDGVFLDPPFHQGLLPRVCVLLHERGLLKPGAFVYVESESEWPALALPPVFVLEKSARAGLVQAFLARYEPAPG